MYGQIKFRNDMGKTITIDPNSRKMTINELYGVGHDFTFDYAEDFNNNHHIYAENIDLFQYEVRMFGDRIVGTIGISGTYYRVCPVCGETHAITIVKDAEMHNGHGRAVHGNKREFYCSNCNSDFGETIIENPYWYDLTVEI